MTQKNFVDWNWEEFEYGPVEDSGKRVHVTLNNRGCIFFNGPALEALGQPDAVTLMYDRRRSVIGIKPSPLHKPNAYKLRRNPSKRSRGRTIAAKNFCRFYSICPDETLAFPAAEVNKDNILILDLNEVRSARRS